MKSIWRTRWESREIGDKKQLGREAEWKGGNGEEKQRFEPKTGGKNRQKIIVNAKGRTNTEG